jgi:hypothetical protein
MSDIPAPVTIPASTHRKLMDINERMAATQQMMQMFQANCEQRLAQLQTEGRQVWHGIKEDTGINLVDVVWDVHPTEFKVVPKQVRVKQD